MRASGPELRRQHVAVLDKDAGSCARWLALGRAENTASDVLSAACREAAGPNLGKV
jgi:hypothetical protein